MTRYHPTFTQAYARTAGALYLLIAISGGFSLGYVPAILSASGDAAATVGNILQNPVLFRLGILGDITVILCELIVTAMLYIMFKPISATLTAIAAFARLSMAIIMGVNLMLQMVPALLLNGGASLSGFSTEQLHSIIYLFIEIHQAGVYVWGLFFGVHLLLLGYLVVKSGFFPKPLGVLMMIGSFGYLLESIAIMTLPDLGILALLKNALLVITVVAEVSFTLWLLSKGVKSPRIAT